MGMSGRMFSHLLAYSLTRRHLENQLAEGIRAYVRLYYDTYTDATTIEPGSLRLLERLVESLDYPGDVDVEEIVREEEAMLNDGGGVRSDSDGSVHQVCTYPPEVDVP